jgi:hypothetical protein
MHDGHARHRDGPERYAAHTPSGPRIAHKLFAAVTCVDKIRSRNADSVSLSYVFVGF